MEKTWVYIIALPPLNTASSVPLTLHHTWECRSLQMASASRGQVTLHPQVFLGKRYEAETSHSDEPLCGCSAHKLHEHNKVDVL